jgi:hypothetical protein
MLNGTSLPNWAASPRRSARDARVPHSASRATRAAAASALPPARPAAAGMALAIPMDASAGTPACRASSSAARHTRLRESAGTTAPPVAAPVPSPVTVRERPVPGATVTVSYRETAR